MANHRREGVVNGFGKRIVLTGLAEAFSAKLTRIRRRQQHYRCISIGSEGRVCYEAAPFIPYTEISGCDGTISEHWSRYDGPGAYNCSAMSGFPNFFLLLGPNAGTGHTSALMAAENSVNYALRVLKPVLNGDAASINLKQDAEDAYIYHVQDALRHRVWNAGCASWYVNDKGWNAMGYPWTQGYYWFRSLFPTWSDWTFKAIQKPVSPRKSPALVLACLLAFGFTVVAHLRGFGIWTANFH